MKIKNVKLSQVSVNEANPRQIEKEAFSKLITSLLVLPKMLELRPIVVDAAMSALGGNMRYRALCAISEYSEEELRSKLGESNDFMKKTEGEQEALVNYWLRWIDSPTAPIIEATELTEQEQREFIIKDNVGFGGWDMDMLANQWDMSELADWGLDMPFAGDGMNLDNFWGEGEVKHKEKGTVIEVALPKELNDSVDEIKEAIEAALVNYNGIKVK